MKPGQLSKHFQRSEFKCKCGCGFDTVDAELVRVLEGTHSHFSGEYGKVRIIISGGNRCRMHNETVQREYNSKYIPFSSQSIHMDAKASDIKVQFWQALTKRYLPVPADDVADYLEKKYPNCYGIGRYNGRTHIDTRSTKARWDKR